MPASEGARGVLAVAMNPSSRFFLATILGGRLHPNGIPEWGLWEASRLRWWPEDHLDLVLTTTRERKVRTTEAGRGYSISLAILFFIRLTAVVKSRRAPSSV